MCASPPHLLDKCIASQDFRREREQKTNPSYLYRCYLQLQNYIKQKNNVPSCVTRRDIKRDEKRTQFLNYFNDLILFQNCVLIY